MKRCNYWDSNRRWEPVLHDAPPTFVGYLHKDGLELFWLNPPNGWTERFVISPPFDSLDEQSRVEKLHSLGLPQEFIDDSIDSWNKDKEYFGR